MVGVRYAPDGAIEWVRAFEKRGATWSDWKLILREDLIDRLEKGQRIVAGKRIPYQAGTFEFGEPLALKGTGASARVTIGSANGEKDALPGVPVV